MADPSTSIDLGLEYTGGIAKPNPDQAHFDARVTDDGLNLEYRPPVQRATGSATWAVGPGQSAEAIHVFGSGARTITLPNVAANDSAYDGMSVLIVDAAGTSAAGNISIVPGGGGTINGSAGLLFVANYSSVRLRLVTKASNAWVKV